MEKQNLDILPGGVLPVIHCSQGDIGRQFQINLYSDNAPYVLDGTEELTLDGHKEDGNIFTYSLPSTTGSIIVISTEEQMTACAGNTICEIRIFKNDTRIGTCNFILQVEEGPSNGTLSDSALQALDEIRAEVQEAVEDAQTAAEDASDYANTAKSWAVGPNGSGTGSDTNNSKYYSQQSANSATASANSASVAHTSEVNAANSEDNASISETNAANSASNASTSETNAANSANAASNSASSASTSANNAANSATDANNAKTDAISAKNDAITAKNAAEDAQQKIENMTASASQLAEGATPTVTKSEIGGVVNLAFGIPKGDTGATGATGPKGEDGLGVPAGGTTGQVLAKASNTDNDTEWVTPSAGGGDTIPTNAPSSVGPSGAYEPSDYVISSDKLNYYGSDTAIYKTFISIYISSSVSSFKVRLPMPVSSYGPRGIMEILDIHIARSHWQTGDTPINDWSFIQSDPNTGDTINELTINLSSAQSGSFKIYAMYA